MALLIWWYGLNVCFLFKKLWAHFVHAAKCNKVLEGYKGIICPYRHNSSWTDSLVDTDETLHRYRVWRHECRGVMPVLNISKEIIICAGQGSLSILKRSRDCLLYRNKAHSWFNSYAPKHIPIFYYRDKTQVQTFYFLINITVFLMAFRTTSILSSDW